MKVYAIATKINEQCGMGDSVDVLVVRPLDVYGTGPYPPVFKEKDKAAAYLDQMGWMGRDGKVVELELW